MLFFSASQIDLRQVDRQIFLIQMAAA